MKLLRRIAMQVVHFVVLQGTWVLAVWGAAEGYLWLAPVIVAAMVIFHLWDQGRHHRLLALGALALVGSLLDSMQSVVPVLRFEGAWASGWCPLWITSLWVHFGLMLIGPLVFLRRHWFLASLLGAVGGPMAYAAGVGLGAAHYGFGAVSASLVLAGLWVLVCPLAVWIMRPSAAPIQEEVA